MSCEIADRRLSESNLSEGIIDFHVEVLNQNDEVVQAGTLTMLVSVRPD